MIKYSVKLTKIPDQITQSAEQKIHSQNIILYQHEENLTYTITSQPVKYYSNISTL